MRMMALMLTLALQQKIRILAVFKLLAMFIVNGRSQDVGDSPHATDTI